MTGGTDGTRAGTDTAPERRGGAAPGSGVRGLLEALAAGAAGVLVTGGLAAVGAFWPALTVLAGAVTASGLLLARRGGRKRYLLAGVAYCLGLAAVIEFRAGAVPPAYAGGVLPGAGGFGAVSAALVIAKAAGKRVVRRLAILVARDEAYWAQVWEALASFASLLSVAWLLATFAEKLVRYAGVSVGAVALLVANALGYRVTVTVLGVEVEAVTALFVGCVLIWFHLLDTLHNSWRAVALSAERAGRERGPAADEEESARTES
ncbi:MAG: hypothetical protein ABEI11_00985 [Haloarculaceae archaeon]